MKKIVNTLVCILSATFVNAQAYLNHYAFECSPGKSTTSLSYCLDQNNNTIISLFADDSIYHTPSNSVVYAETVVKNPGTLLVSCAPNGSVNWKKTWHPVNYLNNFIYGSHVIPDASNNLYMAGRFQGKIDMDPGVNTSYINCGYKYSGEAFLTKLDNTGNFLWAKRIIYNDDTTYNGYVIASVNKIEQLSNGNLQLSCQIGGVADIDPGVGQVWINGSNYHYIPVLIVLDSNGNYVSHKVWSNQSYASLQDTKMDNSNNLICNFYNQDTLDLELGTSNVNVISNGVYGNSVIAKYNSINVLQWYKNIDTNLGVAKMEVLPTGEVLLFMTGVKTITLGNNSTITIPANQSRLILEKYNAQGINLWSKVISGNGNPQAHDLIVHNNYLLTAYKFNDSLILGTGLPINSIYANNYDEAYSAFDLNGNHLSTYQLKSDSVCTNASNRLIANSNQIVAVNGQKGGNVYLGNGSIYNSMFPNNKSSLFISLSALAPLAISNVKSSSKVNLYPNPTSSILNVEFLMTNEDIKIIKLSDLSGRVIKEITTTNNVSQIDMSNVAIGIYLLQIEQDNQLISTQKVERK